MFCGCRGSCEKISFNRHHCGQRKMGLKTSMSRGLCSPLLCLMIATTFDYIVDLHLLMVIILERAIAMLKVVAPAAANLALPD